MLTVRLTADAVFIADDIDDAFAKLAAHFQALATDGLDAPELFLSGRVDIAPVVKDQNEEI